MIIRHEPDQIQFEFYDSFLGLLLIGVTNTHCCWISFVQTTKEDALTHLKMAYPNCSVSNNTQAIASVVTSLQHYHHNTVFTLPFSGYGTPFQHSVWNELSSIPFGETLSYQTIAERIGAPKAVRAVGSAVGKNPISILIPCHRVIRKDGTYHHYRWGKENKKALLTFEGYFRPKSAGISPHC